AVRGAAEVSVEPQGRTVYRLTAGKVPGPEVVVAVVPKLQVTPAGADVLAGAVEPRSHGSITVWRRVAGGWKVVAHPQLDAKGEFHAPLKLHAGGYRVTVDGDGRLAAAT